MEEIEKYGRLRNCCCFCGSPDIQKVKSLRIYRCKLCNQSFVTPSVILVESHKPFPKYLVASTR